MLAPEELLDRWLAEDVGDGDVTSEVDRTGPQVAGPSREQLEELVGGASRDPHGILGAHPDASELVVRALKPDAESVVVVAGELLQRRPVDRAARRVAEHRTGEPGVEHGTARLVRGGQADAVRGAGLAAHAGKPARAR